MASMRRVLAPTDWLDVILKRPICEVDETWVPPQSSRLKSSISSTRTNSPYFSSKNAEGADLGRVLARGDERPHGVVLDDAPVDEVLDLAELLGGGRLAHGEVEAQALGAHHGAALPHVLAEHDAQGVVQQVRRRVVAGRLVAAHGVDHGLGALARGDLALDRARHDDLVVDELDDALDLELAGVGVDPPGVGDLPAALGVERRLGELDGHAAVAELADGAHDGEHLEALVADELGRRLGVPALEVLDLAGPGGEGALLLGRAGALALLLHEVAEALLVDGHVLLGGDLTREVEREAVGVVELEGDLGRQFGAGVTGTAERLLDDPHPLLQGAAEAHLLLLDDAPDLRLCIDQSRVGAAHVVDDGVGERGEERPLDADGHGLLHGAPDDAAQHVVAAVVARAARRP